MTLDQFNKCVDSWADNLYRFVLGIVRSKTLAQDIIQDSYLLLWENRSKVMENKEKSYLFTLAYRASISALRNPRNLPPLDVPIWAMADNTEYDNLTEILWHTLDTMNHAQRTTIMLFDWEGYSYQEIAQIMDISLSQVKITIHRARTTLKEKLGDEYREH
ncbi:MAG: RNA polymerase sigma factor [Mucinivorans sp.]